jgi:hypothetical protein
MFTELDIVVLKRDIPEYKLKAGDVGAVVHVYASEKSYEVEFANNRGETIALLTLEDADLRPMSDWEILHVRGLEQAAA